MGSTSDNRPNWLRGRPQDPPWVRPALLALLAMTAVAYLWGLDQSGWANSFYSAAVQAATKSWKAFFFGSLDAANFITVDKPPASLWIMDLSARLFGLSPWSILVPQALEGVACVYVLYKTIRRWFHPGAALLAGLTLALTPIAAVMFRFNNPDALLVLVLTLSAYALTRALESGKTPWLLVASALIGLGFLTKMLAAFIIIPGFVLVYVAFAPVSWGRRILQIVLSAATVVVASGWWVTIVQLTPAADRPYIDNSTNNSMLNLIFGYNGIGRITGNEFGGDGLFGGAAHAGGFGGFGGRASITRVFGASMGGQISWLIPAALILALFAAWFVHRQWRQDRTLAALVLWTATLVVSGLVFSLSQGISHSYYTVAMAPSVGALIGIGSDVLWKRREQLVARSGLGLAILAAAVWSFVLLERSPNWYPWLHTAVLVAGVVAAVGIVVGPYVTRQVLWGAAAVAVVSGLAGPTAYAMDAITTPQAGASPSAGPAIRSAFGGGRFPGGGGHGDFSARFAEFRGGSADFPLPRGADQSGNHNPSPSRGGFGRGAPSQAIVQLLQQNASQYTWVAATVGAALSAPYQLATRDPVMAIGGFLGSDPAPTLVQFEQYVKAGKIHYFIAGGRGFGGGAFFGGGGAFGGNADRELAEGVGPAGHPQGGNALGPGGFSGQSESAPGSSFRGSGGASEFSRGDFPRGGFGGFGRSSGTASSITQWVESHFTAQTVGGVTVYNLTKSPAPSTQPTS